MSRRLRVVHAPLHGVSATTTQLRKALKLGKGGVVGFSEAYPKRLHYFLLALPLWRAFYGDTAWVDARGRHVGWDVTLMVRRWRRVLDHGSFKAADEVKASLRVAPERWVVWAILGRRKSPILVVAAHPHAVPTPGTARARGYERELALVEDFITKKRAQWPNLRVILIGDLNHRDDEGLLTPADTLRRLGMQWHSVALDWLAWVGLPRPGILIVNPKDNGQDHHWLVADFDRKEQ